MKRYLFVILLCFAIDGACFSQDTRLWATYYGGNGNDGNVCVATDDSGNVFMAGVTNSSTGIASGGFQNTFGGGVIDAFLVKFNSAGNRIWATYYGGPGDEMNFLGGKMGLTTDSSGNVYLAGLTTSTSGIASGGFQNTFGGSVDAFLVKFNPAGNRLWATYYGGASPDKGYGVAVDPFQNVYLTGLTSSSSGISSGGFQNTMAGTGDAFLVKFDSAGNRLWATYYGGPGSEESYSVTTDALGNVFIAGITTSTTSVAASGFQNVYGGGGYDAFLVKFNLAGNRIWSTYFGGSGDEMQLFAGDIEVACDPLNNVYLSGLTTSNASIASSGFQTTFGGGQTDAFLVKYDYLGSRLWSTYYGGSGDDKAFHLATDSASNVWLCGKTTSSSAISSGGFQNAFAGNEDGFIVKFNSTGYRLCASYFGSSDVDGFESMAIDPSGNVYAGGGTASTTGITSGGFQNTFGGGTSDSYLVKFTSCSNPLQVQEEGFGTKVIIYPNPSNGIFSIEQSKIKDGVIEIYDCLGNLIYSIDLSKSQNSIDLSGFPKGIYFLKILSGEETIFDKIILQ